ncbi:hypothetical protein PAXINDRAFT_182558 [Paxillus involutus ATCC 200175]|uniref:Uncharacterized protein n=1 Tax=Paxillus involutus ATCC 200175 TaxID=664439 RepID=A0A0C9TGE2_PAXIN|nr:hypothetical protein PAXINDRAFT_182558 [Paxillus involutus ATCC 200175]
MADNGEDTPAVHCIGEDITCFVPNPKGKNQHKHCPASDDERVAEILRDYHRKNITNKKTISKLLWAEHGIHMSRTTSCSLSTTVKRQLVLDQMAKDPARRQGPDLIKEGIAFDQGIHLSRDFVTSEMRHHDPGGFKLRDGHDKLTSIGFPIWGVRDKWSGKWLGLWVVPNNRLKSAVAYLYLSTIESVGGMPLQMTTDCGSETTQVFGLTNALREEFAPQYSTEALPPHRFLKSVRNIVIEHGWLRFHLQWGANAKIWWDAGEGIYNPTDPRHYELVQWLWSTFVQRELDHLRDRLNNHPTRFDAGKKLPSGVSPNVAIALVDKYGGKDCLLPVDLAVIRRLKESIGGEDLIWFVTADYARRAETAFATLGINAIVSDNIWHIFTKMLPLLYA